MAGNVWGKFHLDLEKIAQELHVSEDNVKWLVSVILLEVDGVLNDLGTLAKKLDQIPDYRKTQFVRSENRDDIWQIEVPTRQFK